MSVSTVTILDLGCKPTAAYGLPELHLTDAQNQRLRDWRNAGSPMGEPVAIPVGDVVASCQTEGILPGVVEHYLSSDDLWDPDGWYGTDAPVYMLVKGGYAVLDGNHRTLAAITRGDATINAHVIQG